jgi:hypothetical protein
MKRYANLLDCEGTCRDLLPSPHLPPGRRSRWPAAASPHDACCWPPQHVTPGSTGSVQPPSPPGWRDGERCCASWPRVPPRLTWRARRASHGPWCVSGPSAFSPSGWRGSPTPLAVGPRAVFPPEGALHVVRLACARPDALGRSRSQGDGPARARQLIAPGSVADLSAATGRRMLAAPQLQPWRQHGWLDPTPPRAAAF